MSFKALNGSSMGTEMTNREGAKLAFLKKYYPGVNNSPGGTFKLEGRGKMTSRQMDTERHYKVWWSLFGEEF